MSWSPGSRIPGVEPGLAGDWRAEEPSGALQAALRQIHAGPGGSWYGRTRWRVWRSPDRGASWQPATFMLPGRDRDLSLVRGDVEDPLTAYVIEVVGPSFLGRVQGNLRDP